MNLIFHPDAEEELQSATEHYEAARPGLDDQFAAAVRTRLQVIVTDPTSCGRIVHDVHRARVPRFPYDVLFAVDHEEVYVLAVMHHHRRPGDWKYRVTR